jgi:hypothetical protein
MWHYILKGLYLKASAHNSELNGTEMKKKVHSTIKTLFSELCHKKTGSGWQGAVKTSC